MIRVFLAATALALLPLGSRAGETVVRLNVRPMSAPKPALKYQLLPEVRELNPGNSVQYYLRCFAEQNNFFYSKEATTERARYRTMPLAELPAEKLRRYGGSALTQADWAARLDTPDWEVLQRVQNDGMDLLLPELRPLQILAGALQVRFRGEVARGDFDDATRTAKTMFTLARHLGLHPTEAANLVGLSFAHLTLDTLEEMVGQPKCPNLYWALTDLPCPLVDLRKGLQGNRTLVAADLRLLREDSPMTEAELEELVSHLSGGMGFTREQAGQAPRSFRVSLKARIKDPERVRAARARLIEGGCAENLVRKLPPEQVILLDEKREYEVQRDEGMKLLALAPWQIDTLNQGHEPGSRGDGLFTIFLPQVIKARRAQGGLEQRIALLRHVEALRLYAADHDVKLPVKLADVTVPLPVDPFSGKPFLYTLEGGTAHLRGSPPRGEENNPTYNLHYEVTLQK
jgi:hypothetical protein